MRIDACEMRSRNPDNVDAAFKEMGKKSTSLPCGNASPRDLQGAGDLRIKQPIREQNYLASLDLYASWEIACSAQACTNQPLSVN